MAASSPFEIECQDDTLIVTPVSDLGEFDYLQLLDDTKETLQLIEQSDTRRNVVVDFHKTDYFGSTVLGLFVRLWKRVSSRNGRMVFCNLSEHEREILTIANLDELWPICDSREDAVTVASR